MIYPLVSRRVCLCLVALLLGGCATGPVKPPPTELQSGVMTQHTERIWQRPLSADAGHYLSPVIESDNLFLVSSTGQVTLHTLQSAMVKWQVDLGEDVYADPALDDQSLYVGTAEGELLALSRDDGSIRWQSTMSSEIIAQPVLYSDKVIVRSIDGVVAAFDTRNGQLLWGYRHGVPSLTVRGNSSVVIDPDNHLALIGTDSGKLLVLDADSGNFLWDHSLIVSSGRFAVERLSDIDQCLFLHDGSLNLCIFPDQFVSFNLAERVVRWSVPTPIVIGSGRAQDNYLVGVDGELMAVDDAGAVRWQNDALLYRELTAPVVLEEAGLIAVGDLGGYVHLLDSESGDVHSRFRLQHSPVISLHLYSEGLLVQHDKGQLFALKLIDN